MNKYNLIHTITGEKHLCDKVKIDDDYYYISKPGLDVQVGEWFVLNNKLYQLATIEDAYWYYEGVKQMNHLWNLDEAFTNYDLVVENWQKVIATSNPDTLIPCLFDTVQDDAELSHSAYQISLGNFTYPTINHYVKAYKNGYYNRAKTHAFTKEDMIAFGKYCQDFNWDSVENLFEKYIEQKPTTLYYE